MKIHGMFETKDEMYEWIFEKFKTQFPDSVPKILEWAPWERNAIIISFNDEPDYRGLFKWSFLWGNSRFSWTRLEIPETRF